MSKRLDEMSGPDDVREEFDRWRAGVDPEGKMDCYQLARERLKAKEPT